VSTQEPVEGRHEAGRSGVGPQSLIETGYAGVEVRPESVVGADQSPKVPEVGSRIGRVDCTQSAQQGHRVRGT